MATKQTTFGEQQTSLDLFARESTDTVEFPAYREWRAKIEPPENPCEEFDGEEQWDVYLDEGDYRVDWESISDQPDLMVAIYQHKRNDANSFGAKTVARRIIKHSDDTFHPAVVDIPIPLVEELLSIRETTELKEEDNDVISHVKRGFINATFNGNRMRERFVDWNGDERRIQRSDSFIRRVENIDVLEVLRDVVDALPRAYSRAVEERYLELIYSRVHTPENRSETMFSGLTQANIDSAVSFMMTKYASGKLYKNLHTVRWEKFFRVVSDEELERAIINVFTEERELAENRKYNGKDVNPFKNPHHFVEMEGFFDAERRVDSIGVVLSVLSDESLVRVVERLDENGVLSETFLTAALVFGATHTGRQVLYNEYSDSELFPERSTVVQLQFTENYERWKELFIDEWHKRGGTLVHTLMQAGARHVGDNVGAGRDTVQVYAKHMPFDELVVSDTFKRHIKRLYDETQKYYSRHDEEKWRTVYRGVSGSDGEPYTPATVESWSEHKREARKFVNDHNDVLKREVQLKNVLATYESLGDAWPENDVKGKKEWMVLGAGVRYPRNS